MKTRIKNNIRRLRFEANEMSQQVLADRVGVTRQTINAIELSKHSPSLELAFLISDMFVMPVEEVFFRPPPTGSNDEDATIIELKRKRAG